MVDPYQFAVSRQDDLRTAEEERKRKKIKELNDLVINFPKLINAEEYNRARKQIEISGTFEIPSMRAVIDETTGKPKMEQEGVIPSTFEQPIGPSPLQPSEVETTPLPSFLRGTELERSGATGARIVNREPESPYIYEGKPSSEIPIMKPMMKPRTFEKQYKPFAPQRTTGRGKTPEAQALSEARMLFNNWVTNTEAGISATQEEQDEKFDSLFADALAKIKGKTPPPLPKPTYKTADEVKKAFKDGKINKEQALLILKRDFGMK